MYNYSQEDITQIALTYFHNIFNPFFKTNYFEEHLMCINFWKFLKNFHLKQISSKQFRISQDLISNQELLGAYFCYLPLALIQKSDNLQYDTLFCWFLKINELSTKYLLMFQVLFFFIISCKIICKNCFIFFINLQK